MLTNHYRGWIGTYAVTLNNDGRGIVSNSNKLGHCPLCHRYTRLTFHHLVPRKLHRRRHFRKNLSYAERNRGIVICRQCHDAIHRFYTEMELAKHFTSLAQLQQDEKLARHFEWVAKQAVRV